MQPALEPQLRRGGDAEADLAGAHRPAQLRGLRPEAGEVGGAAGAVEPGLALAGVGRIGAGGERVLVEEAVAGEGDAGGDAVVEGALEDVEVARLAGDPVHAAREEREPDRGAALGVGGEVVELVVALERLAAAVGADAARDEHPAPRGVLPHRAAGLEQALVAGRGGDVRHAAAEVRPAHRVADGLALVARRFVRLEVGEAPLVPALLLHVVVGLAAALVDEVGGEIEPLLLARRPGEAAERQLDLLVPGVAALLPAPAAERLRDEARVAAHRVEKEALARRLEVRDGGLHEVARAVELVPVVEVRPALLRLDEGEVRVEVAVGPLRGDDEAREGVEPPRERGVGAARELARHALGDLGDVAVPEDVREPLVALPPLQLERVDAVLLLEVLQAGGDRGGAVRLDAGREDGIGERDGGRGGDCELHGAGGEGVAARRRS